MLFKICYDYSSSQIKFSLMELIELCNYSSFNILHLYVTSLIILFKSNYYYDADKSSFAENDDGTII